MKRVAILLPLVLALFFPFVILAKKDEVEKKKIVLIAGSRSHASGEHEFRAGCLLLARALNEESGLDVEAVVVGENWKKDKSVLDDADAIFIFADGVSGIGGEWKYLDTLAKKGVGMAFMHYAVHPNAKQGRKYYQPWIGGAMESGWSVNPHWLADLKVDQEHEIGNGIPETVTCLDEFYYNMRFVNDRESVLDLVRATPTRENMRRYINLWNKHGVDGLNKEQTLMWGYERPNGGRGVGFTGGHYHRNWALDGFRTVVLNAIVWTTGMKVPEGGVKSKSLTKEDLNANLDSYDAGKMKVLDLPTLEEWQKVKAAKVDEKREAKFKK